jgi:hypothetical protein
MSYEVRCECGKTRAVGAADAGTSVRCPCGRSVDVPPLHVLRASVGEPSISPIIQIQALLTRGELPGARDCACCHRVTDHLIRVSVVCERAIPQGPSVATTAATGCLMILTGIFIFSSSSASAASAQHGSEVSFILPVRMCEGCARYVTTPQAIRTALATTPAYAALLARYPNALIRRAG